MRSMRLGRPGAVPLDAVARGAIRMPGQPIAEGAGVPPPQEMYDAPHLARNPANFAALSPLGFLSRAASIYPDKVAVVHGERRFTYREFYRRCCRFADA